MRKDAIRQAWDEIRRAENAEALLRSKASAERMEDAWKQFLDASAVVFNKLHAGARGNGKSEGWVGKIRHERKTDPLLSYLHHARDVATHGLRRISEQRAPATEIRGHVNVNFMDAKTGLMDIAQEPGGQSVKVSYLPERIELVTVVDEKYKMTFEVPKSHLGSPLTERTPTELARLALAHLRKIITEAATFVV